MGSGPSNSGGGGSVGGSTGGGSSGGGSSGSTGGGGSSSSSTGGVGSSSSGGAGASSSSSRGGGGADSGSSGGADFSRSVADVENGRGPDDGNRGDDNDRSASPSNNSAASANAGSSSTVDDAGSYFGDFAFSSGAPALDAAPPADNDNNNNRSTSPSNAGMDEEANYSIDTSSISRNTPADPGLTPNQSAALAESAAVMSGYSLETATPPTKPADIAGPFATHTLAKGEEVAATPEPTSLGEMAMNTAEFAGGVAVGAAETAWDGVVGAAGLAWEGVNMVNDAAGTVLDTAVGWTGIDAFEGHSQRNAARGQAMVDAVVSLPEVPGKIANSVEQGWETFEDNLEDGNYYDAGKQTGAVGLEVATIAVPAAKAGALAKAGKVDDAAAATVSRYNALDNQGHAVSRHGAHVTDQMLEDRAVRGIDPMTGTPFDGVRSTPGNQVEHTAPRNATSINNVDSFVEAERSIRASEQYRDARDTALANGKPRFEAEIPMESALGKDYLDQVQGQTRIGSAKHPSGATPTDLTDGKIKGVFELNPGHEPNLVTMHPTVKK